MWIVDEQGNKLHMPIPINWKILKHAYETLENPIIHAFCKKFAVDQYKEFSIKDYEIKLKYLDIFKIQLSPKSVMWLNQFTNHLPLAPCIFFLKYSKDDEFILITKEEVKATAKDRVLVDWAEVARLEFKLWR